MMPKTKVLFAYCHELKRSVSIDEARTEFFSAEEEKRKKFTFSCSDRHCKVTISGVNYHVKAEDGHKYKAAHFRSPHPHLFGCEWTQFTEEAEQDRQPDESDGDFTERKARLKLTDYITCFDPSIDDHDAEPASSGQLPSNVSVNSPSASGSSGEGKSTRWSQYTRTNQLQRLVDSWQEAKKKLSHTELRAQRLTVVNHGQIFTHRYITHINNGLTNQYDGVVYGGGTLIKRYGRGFLIRFIDQHDERPIFLYVNKDMMAKGGFSHYVDEILKTENVRYFRIFLLNPFISEKENSVGKPVINLEISKLRQLAIYYELNSKTEDESGSVENDGESRA